MRTGFFSQSDKAESGSAYWDNSSGEFVEVTKVVETTAQGEAYVKEFPDAKNKGSVGKFMKTVVPGKKDSAAVERTR